MTTELINALRKEGKYTFLVEVRRNDNEATMREDKIALNENDSKDSDAQKQLDDYMSKNNVNKNKSQWEYSLGSSL